MENSVMLVSKNDLVEYCYLLFQHIIKKHVSTSMIPFTSTSKIDKYNAYYALKDVKNSQLLRKAIRLLSNVTRYNSVSNTVDFRHGGAIQALRSIQNALLMIETSKIPLFMRIVKKRLEKHSTMKIVICVNYTKTIEDLVNGLQEYKPLVLQGNMSAKKRMKAIELFQTPSTEHRLLIGNVSVCSSGIDLDDQHGKYPRLCLVSPNYSTITLYQLCHRFQRANTKSNAMVHFVFCAEGAELNILHALAIKSTIMKEITEKQVEYGIKFPVDFESWYETPTVKKIIMLEQSKLKKKY
jgi:hypothetical protein